MYFRKSAWFRPEKKYKKMVTTSNILSLYFDGINLWIGTSEGLVRLKLGNELAHLKK